MSAAHNVDRVPHHGPDHDYVVIGAGAAGCVLANRLSASPATSVLLLEAGPADDDPRIADPDRWARLQGSELDWDLASPPQPGLDGRVVPCPRGRVLGGSTAMNAMVWLRGDTRDFDGWNLGPEWSSSRLWPLYERAETIDGAGTGIGPTRGEPHPWSQALLNAAGELGYPAVEDFNRDGPRGAGRYAVTRENGRRRGAVASYLRPAAARPNLTVVTDATVRALRIESGTVVGVEFTTRDGRTRVARPGAEVLLAAGVIGSPHLLLRSGIGPAALLRERGLPVTVDLPGVGANLVDHVAVSVPFRAAAPDPASSRAGLGDVGVFHGASDRGPAPLHVWLGPSTDPPGHTFSLAVGLTHPASRGGLRWTDTLDPVPAPGYLTEPDDLDALVEGLEILHHLAGTAALRPLWTDRPPEVLGASRAARADYVRANASTQFHLVGTCRMGVDESCVVDPALRVRGTTNLRVVDASVLPAITTGGPQAPTFLIAERGAELVRA